ncbi:MAG: amidohydrolase family protein [Fluviicola sp.]|nr:amidohydrolase family protein [Fluviicola sp.]
MRILFVLLFSLLVSLSFSQIKPNNGAATSKPAYYALKNATIYISPGRIVNNATLLIKDDKIIDVGKGVKTPKDAVFIDCEGKIILPAFIELNSNIGMPELKKKAYTGRPQYESSKKGSFYWNEAIHPEVDANLIYTSDAKKNEALIKMGFGYALTRQQDGVAQGNAAFVALTDGAKSLLPNPELSSYFSFKKGNSRQSYPSSQMGSIALLRQLFYDAAWYKESAKDKNLSLESLNNQLNGSLIFSTTDKLEILRANKIAHEFDLSFNYIGSGNEYEVIDQLMDLNSTLILPINFPKPYDVENPYVSRQIPLSDLKHWEMAPMNPMLLKQRGIDICLSSMQQKTAKDFWSNLRSAILHGLSVEDALNALTVQPSIITGVSEAVGTLDAGKFASFIIYDKSPFEESAKVLESWILGEQKVYAEKVNNDIAGKYNLIIQEKKFPVEIKGNSAKYSGKLTYQYQGEESLQDSTVKMKVIANENNVTLQFNIADTSWTGSVTLQGKSNPKFGVFEGEGMLPTGEWVKWTAVKTKKGDTKKKKKSTVVKDTLNYSWFPNMAYGFDSIPQPETIVIENATLWTNEEEGIVKNATIILKNGKIDFIGTGNYRTPNGARVIDAKGKHVTSGIIDEHSHIAISKGVNESGQAISAEVRIGDVINSDDINIYRQLSGGVTASQLLHGSANPVGGQSALIKLKWGHTTEEMLIPNADNFIKFALGENVKQSNWGSANKIRFPQTRMGVEQLYLDGFTRANVYAKEMADFKKDGGSKPRIDLELEALSEILQSNRFITCHSYVQSEINMLMHVADSLGFKVNTFTHILEGYKLADKMVEHGVGGSTFSDWWAYKFEVNDAIPYNAALMSKQGVVVAINSDDAEMGRRLNQEAAKGVKYGGMSEIEAWKMVTLNPAKLLHLDDRMGSLKKGKDADVVIWSDNPLSILAKVEYTIVDGEILYSQENDLLLRKRNQAEKARIISKMLADETPKDEKRAFIKKKQGHYHCNTIGEEMSTGANHH